MQRFYSIVTLLCLLTSLVCAQKSNDELPPDSENLIFNPSFEEYTECPKRIEATGHLSIVDGWFQPTGGSADYFNRCGNGACGVPRSKMGFQEPHSGQGYCGIYCNKTEYREYLQTELKQPLQAGCTYRVTFYVSLSEYSTCAIATMGALLTSNRVEDTARNMLTKKEIRKLDNGMKQSISAYFIPQVQNSHDKPLIDWRRWQKISGTFRAEGGERFLTIGNFATAAKSNITVPDSLTQELTGSYYFIDDVSLVLIDCPKDVADTTESKQTNSLFRPSSPSKRRRVKANKKKSLKNLKVSLSPKAVSSCYATSSLTLTKAHYSSNRIKNYKGCSPS